MGGHRFHHLGDRHDARCQQDRFALQQLSIAAAVHSLMVLLRDVRIELPEVGLLTVALEVRNIREHDEGVRRNLRRYGCQFIGIAPSVTNSIQRYITKIQRERNPRT